MKVIYKYQLSTTTSFDILLNEGCKFLSIQVVNSIPYLWVELDRDKSLILYSIDVYVTGQKFESKYPYIGTAVLENGRFVAHYYGGPLS